MIATRSFVIAPTLDRAREVAREMDLPLARFFSANSPRSLDGVFFLSGDRVVVVGIAKGASGKSFLIMDVLRRCLAKSRHAIEPEYVP